MHLDHQTRRIDYVCLNFYLTLKHLFTHSFLLLQLFGVGVRESHMSRFVGDDLLPGHQQLDVGLGHQQLDVGLDQGISHVALQRPDAYLFGPSN